MPNLTAFVQVLAGVFSFSTLATAQIAEFKMQKSEHLMHVIIPAVVVGNEFGARLEFNLAGEASIALDYIHIPEGQELSEERMKEEHASLINTGREIAVTMTRFSRGDEMGGFYYSLGGGYRTLDTVWKKQPDSQYGISSQELIDEDGNFTHKLQGTGATARGRLGYRYVGESWPLLAGCFLGIRHYESKFEDRKSKEAVATTPEEKEELRRIFMSKPEIGVEFGFSF